MKPQRWYLQGLLRNGRWQLFSGERDRLSRLFAAADEGVAKDEAEVVEKERKLRGVYGDANEAAGVYGEV